MNLGVWNTLGDWQSENEPLDIAFNLTRPTFMTRALTFSGNQPNIPIPKRYFSGVIETPQINGVIE